MKHNLKCVLSLFSFKSFAYSLNFKIWLVTCNESFWLCSNFTPAYPTVKHFWHLLKWILHACQRILVKKKSINIWRHSSFKLLVWLHQFDLHLISKHGEPPNPLLQFFLFCFVYLCLFIIFRSESWCCCFDSLLFDSYRCHTIDSLHCRSTDS